MKKILLVTFTFIISLTLMGCGAKNVEGTLEEIMSKVYSTLGEDETPMMLTNTEITKENIEMYLGTSDIEFEEALASESATGSIAHSVVLLRVKDNADVEAIKEKIEDNVNPRKWICVGVEEDDIVVENKGNLIILIMVSDEATREKLETSFENLK